MIKLRKHITPILTLALLEFCFFVFGNYPKNLFDVRLMNITYNYLPDFFAKLLWILLCVSAVLLICKWIFFSERYAFISEYFKDVLNCSVKILLIRLILDGVMLLTPPLLYVDAIHFILDLFFTAMLFLIIYKRLAIGKKIKINKKVILSTIILIAVSATYAVLSIYKTKQGMDLINYLNEKYIYISMPNVTKNLSFELSLYRLLFNIISVILIYIIFLNTFENNAKADNIKKALIITRCFLLIMGLIFLYAIKLLIIPQNTISRINVNTSDSHHYQKPDVFDTDYRITNIYRQQSYNHEGESVYSKTKIKIKYSGKLVDTYKRIIPQDTDRVIEHGDGVYSVNTEAIMYMENNKPVVILTKDINKHKEDEKLTEALEKLIALNYFDFLECSYEYMIMYDEDYIKPFLEEYSSGIYDENINQNIKKEYIIKFSQDVLNKNF